MNRYNEFDDEDAGCPPLEIDNDTEEEDAEPAEEAVPPVPLWLSLRYGLGTFVAAGLVDLVAHFGPTGLVVGGIAAYAASQHGPGLVEHLKEALPAPVSRHWQERRRDGSRSYPHVRSAQTRALAEEDEDEDTLLVEEDEDEEVPALPDTLALGSLRPHADLMFSHRVVALGMPGSGKSNVVAVLVEELGRYDAPLLVFDHKPEYDPLCQFPYLSNPVRLSARTLTPQNAAEMARRLMAERWQAVLDLSSYASDAQAAYVMTELIAGVLRYQQTRNDRERLPATFVLDEAHYWLPEHEGHSTIRGTKLRTGQTLLSYVQQAFFTLAKLGRTFGMGLIVATQRPADVDKRLISTADWRFLLQTLEPTDLKVYRSYGLSSEQAMALNPKRGEAYVIGPDGVRGLYHIRRRYSPDVATSPGLDNIRQAGPAPSRRGDSPLPASPIGAYHPLDSRWEAFPTGNGESSGNGFPGGSRSWESSQVPGNEREDSPLSGKDDKEGYTPAEEIAVLSTYAALLKEGEPVTRTAIKERLQWSSRQFSRIIKPVCDKHGIA